MENQENIADIDFEKELLSLKEDQDKYIQKLTSDNK